MVLNKTYRSLLKVKGAKSAPPKRLSRILKTVLYIFINQLSNFSSGLFRFVFVSSMIAKEPKTRGISPNLRDNLNAKNISVICQHRVIMYDMLTNCRKISRVQMITQISATWGQTLSFELINAVGQYHLWGFSLSYCLYPPSLTLGMVHTGS